MGDPRERERGSGVPAEVIGWGGGMNIGCAKVLGGKQPMGENTNNIRCAGSAEPVKGNNALTVRRDCTSGP